MWIWFQHLKNTTLKGLTNSESSVLMGFSNLMWEYERTNPGTKGPFPPLENFDAFVIGCFHAHGSTQKSPVKVWQFCLHAAAQEFPHVRLSLENQITAAAAPQLSARSGRRGAAEASRQCQRRVGERMGEGGGEGGTPQEAWLKAFIAKRLLLLEAEGMSFWRTSIWFNIFRRSFLADLIFKRLW